jgi:hypothetical protein
MYWSESQELLSIRFTKEGLEITPIGAKSFEMGMGKNKLQTFNSKTPISASTRANQWLLIKPIVKAPEPQIVNLFRLRW